MYRYWYENIHKRKEDCDTDYYSKHSEYKIVYLVPDKAKQISDNSKTRPIDYPIDLPDKLPMEPIVMDFHEDIPKWLRKCMVSVYEDNSGNSVSRWQQ